MKTILLAILSLSSGCTAKTATLPTQYDVKIDPSYTVDQMVPTLEAMADWGNRTPVIFLPIESPCPLDAPATICVRVVEGEAPAGDTVPNRGEFSSSIAVAWGLDAASFGRAMRRELGHAMGLSDGPPGSLMGNGSDIVTCADVEQYAVLHGEVSGCAQ